MKSTGVLPLLLWYILQVSAYQDLDFYRERCRKELELKRKTQQRSEGDQFIKARYKKVTNSNDVLKTFNNEPSRLNCVQRCKRFANGECYGVNYNQESNICQLLKKYDPSSYSPTSEDGSEGWVSFVRRIEKVSNEFFMAEEQSVDEYKVLRRIPILQKTWFISIEFNVTKKLTQEWCNMFRVGYGRHNYDYGNRVPLFHLYGALEDTFNGLPKPANKNNLHISSSIDVNPSTAWWSWVAEDGFQRATVMQTTDDSGDSTEYHVYLNDNLEMSKYNFGAQVFYDSEISILDKWYDACPDVIIRNIHHINGCGEP
eukprot:TCONS_00003096-protein